MKFDFLSPGRLTMWFCALAAVLAFVAAQPSAALQDNMGRDFILSFTPNFRAPEVNIEVHLTASEATDVTIEYPVNSPVFTTTVSVTPGSIVTVALPTSAAMGWPSDIVTNNSVRISANGEVVAYLINRYRATSDAALGLPVDALNTEYIISTFDVPKTWPYPAQFTIVGVYDGTSVSVIPSNDLIGGHPAGVPYEMILNRGEGILLEQLVSGPNGGLAGTIVSADKPVSVTNGNRCTQVPTGIFACDMLMEVAQPVQSWGREILVTNAPDRPTGVVYRVFASQDATEVLQDGLSIGTINRGQFLEVGPLPGGHVFSSTNPIFAAQFITGVDSPGATRGDPSMTNFGPIEQYLNAYTFSTAGGQQFNEHFLMIIAANTDVGNLTLDSVVIAAEHFSPIGGTDYSSAVIPLTEGTHQTLSVNGHGIWVVGYNQAASYSFPGGAGFQFINNAGDPWAPVCRAELVTGDPAHFRLIASELHPEEDGLGTDNRETGIFLVELLDGSSNLALNQLIFIPGSSETSLVANIIDQSLSASGTIRFTDGAGNFCEAVLNSEVNIDCEGTPGGGKVLDRCGICGGDGRSCYQCTEKDIRPQVNSMSSDALKAHKHNLKLLRAMKNNWTLQKKLTKESQKLFRQIQSLLLEFPSFARECLNLDLCVTASDNQTRLASYRELMQRLVSVAKRLPRGRCSRSDTRCQARRPLPGIDRYSRSLFTSSQNTASSVPGSTSTCE